MASGDLPPDVVLIGGSENDQIRVVDYDIRWASRFHTEHVKILAALGNSCRRIEHIGSTSVPGLAAKPIVDVLVTVDDLDDDGRIVAALEGVGYRLRVIEPGHRLLRTPERDVHVHIWTNGCDEERAYLVFRDWLRVSPEDRDRYAEAKRRLAQRTWPDMNDYARAKTSVVAAILMHAESWARGSGWHL